MAEGLLRGLGGEQFDVYSAGTEATRVRPLAIKAMGELDIDISAQESKTLDRYLDQPFDAVITVCDQANEACPCFSAPSDDCTGAFRIRQKRRETKRSRCRCTALFAMPSASGSRMSFWGRSDAMGVKGCLPKCLGGRTER